MTKVTIPITVELEDLWSDIFGSGWEYSDWFVHIDYGDGDWDRPSTIVVKHFSKDDEEIVMRTTLTVEDVVNAYAKLAQQRYTHCGGCALDDPDACTSDAVLQHAVYGDIIYG